MGCSPSVRKHASQSGVNSRSQLSLSGVNRLRSAVLIQAWYRRYCARLEVRRRCTWNIFQHIEYSGEQDQLKLHNFFNNMLVNMSSDGTDQAPLIKAFNKNKRPSIYDIHAQGEDDSEKLQKLLEGIKVDSTYKGPHLTFPVTLNQLHKMVQAFKRKLTLHAKYTIQLLIEVRRLLKRYGNIRYATTSLSKQVTICGDIHGKLTDLYMIFHKNGLPGVDNPYIFNGDFVDRGIFSTEVAIILFACFLMNPNEVYINRGNHEDHVMNLRYGFIKELQVKYRGYSRKVIRLFEDVFSWLPLATVIDDQILVCHGGISDTTDLAVVAGIDRHRYLSTLQPPGGCEDITAMSQEELIEWKQMLDLLWSDPKTQPGCESNTFRGGGSYFGPDVTDSFLKKNNLKLIIRSHECKPEGYEYTHEGKVLTVFSASSYYEVGSNRGAYVRVQGPEHKCQIIQFMATSSLAVRKTTFTQRINVVEQSALRDLRGKILGTKSKLLGEFKKYDTTGSGKITCSEWCSVMESVLQMSLPWRTLRSKLVRTDSDDNVFYESAFDELQVRHRYSGNGPSITETLYKHKDNLETIFRMMDTDNSGLISMEEFEDALTLLIKQLDINIKQNDIRDIAHSIDINHDGNIDFNEFLEAFRIVDNLGKDKTERVSRREQPQEVELSPVKDGDVD